MLIHLLDQQPVKKLEGPIGLILCPTRELCQQVYSETKRYGRLFDVSISTVLGGENKHEQFKELRKGIDVIIGTPGRLIDLYKKKAFNFLRTSFIVIDEADRMFGLGFEPQIRAILNQVRPDRQTLLFSATYDDEIRSLSLDYLIDPVQISVGNKDTANEDIKQEVFVVQKIESKMEWLLDNIDRMIQNGKVLIFCNHIKTCNDLGKVFTEFAPKIDKVVIHGDKIQQERTRIIRAFKKDVQVMIATDVASRGLDIPAIKFVVNYENPRDWETYVHRIGRTGRAGSKDGVAITLILKKEWKFASQMAIQFNALGLAVPPDLHDLASKDTKYREMEWKSKMGFTSDKQNKSSQLLERALNAGQKTKKGLGFKNKKGKDKGRGKTRHQMNKISMNQLYGEDGTRTKSNLNTLNDEMRDLVNEVVAEEYKIKESEKYNNRGDQYVVTKKVSRFTNIGEAPRTEKYENVAVSAVDLQRMKLEKKTQAKKLTLKNKFLNGFVKKGTLDVTHPKE